MRRRKHQLKRRTAFRARSKRCDAKHRDARPTDGACFERWMLTAPATLGVSTRSGAWVSAFLQAWATTGPLPWVVIDPQPLSESELRLHLDALLAHDDARSDALRAAAAHLIAAWPPLTPNTHVLTWPNLEEDGLRATTLHLVVAPLRNALTSVLGTFTAVHWWLDPATTTPWDQHDLKALARVSGAGAPLTVHGVQDALSQAEVDLPSAGFVVETQTLDAGSATATATARPPQSQQPLPSLHARYAPQGPARDRLARLGPTITKPKRVVVLGAGLAGAHVAHALAKRGIPCTVVDRHAEPATEGSGGSAGIYHGTVHASDGAHARLYRAAALQAALWHAEAIRHGVEGQASGLLRWSEETPNALEARMHAQRLPTTWVQSMAAHDAQRLAGGDAGHPAAWLFPGGGWINPRALVAWQLRHPWVTWLGDQNVHAMHRSSGSVSVSGNIPKENDDANMCADSDSHWVLTDPQGHTIACATHVVLTNAVDAARLCPHAAWPLAPSRGQSLQLPAGTVGLQAPRIAVSGNGYAVTALDGSVHVGASSTMDDTQTAPRESDALENLRKLAYLTGSDVQASAAWPHPARHRVGWRASTPDKLPIVGAVPRFAANPRDVGEPSAAPLGNARSPLGNATSSPGRAIHHARHVPREAGLYVLSGLGSRGLTLAPLMAQVVVASMLREPMPLEAELLDVVDAARFVAKQGRA
jgi:tRNA 5-methylaminomethyl-2-thiouridine biosynthesis bifunctional protein